MYPGTRLLSLALALRGSANERESVTFGQLKTLTPEGRVARARLHPTLATVTPPNFKYHKLNCSTPKIRPPPPRT
eukprot:3332340-Rhodomonas_salina.1